jgi:uncharacterized phage protein gp47/JayE
MTLNLPSNRKEVYDRLVSDTTAQIPDSGAFLPTSYLASMLKALAYRIYDNYQKISIMINQFFVQTATGLYIERWGNIWGITRNAATGSSGNIVLSGTADTTIPTGTTLQSASGLSYTTQSDTTISQSTISVSSMSRIGTTVTVNFTAEHNLASGITIDSITGASPSDFNASNVLITVTSPTQFQFTQAGTSGSATGTIVAQWTTANVEVDSSTQGENTNITAGGVLTLSSPIAGVNNNSFVDYNEISGGADQEDDDSYRERVLFRIQFPFSFFNVNALINQAKLVAGVTRVWIFSPSTTSASISISNLTRSGQIATATSTAHGLVDGNFVTITGAVQSQYNVVEQRVIVIDANNFAFVVSGSPTSPATGTILASYSYVEEGQVRIGFTRDNDDSIIPSAGEVNTVKSKILEIKPAHMSEDDVIVFAPTAVPINITFSSLSPNTTSMRTAITNALTDFFKLSNNIGENVKLADINGLISQTIDSNGNVPIYTLSAPSADTVIGLNQIGTLGVITYA